jgi:hypothetical protein
MRFIDTQTKDSINYYNRLLKILGSLSNLFSDSAVPYLNYRISENLFCKSFEAENLSRSDVSADASKNSIGIGIKTFQEGNGNTLQKIAEFNKLRTKYADIKDVRKKIETISSFRNDRIEFTKRNHALSELAYHCIVRNKGVIKYYDVDFVPINVPAISNINHSKDNIITFDDGLNEYSFNISKSTLYKRFPTPRDCIGIPIEIIKDPFEALEDFFGESLDEIVMERKDEKPYIYLPLYSFKGEEKVVYPKSGLNAWNAAGRERDPNEAYLQNPVEVRKNYPNFFPPSDEDFELILPNGQILSARVVQEGGKAITSNPNKDLGEWLLRDVLGLEEGELLTYDKLENVGVDSVLLRKEAEGEYSINFAKLGKYESFLEKNIV